MRGKVSGNGRRFHRHGITPACAGKRTCTATRRCGNGDHPRVCGEKAATPNVEAFYEGSPPRVRGKEVVLVDFICLRGITPACAGKSHSVTDANASSWDHPRVCGEKALQSSVNCTMEGSPPRMRGKATGPPRSSGPGGITPAYAGKRVEGQYVDWRFWDHPRVCGEKHQTFDSAAFPTGSPPRMRGKVPCRRVDQCRLPVFQVLADTVPHCIPDAAAHIAHINAGVDLTQPLGQVAAQAGRAGPPGPAPPPQMRLGWSPPPCTGRQCRTRKSTHARRARIPVPAHTPAPQ